MIERMAESDQERLIADLYETTPIDQFAKRVQEIRTELGAEHFLLSISKIREADIAANCGALFGASHVRLCQTAQPDWYVTIFGVEIGFEQTEWMNPGRKRDKEMIDDLKEADGQEDNSPNFVRYSWASLDVASEALTRLAEKKAKSYRGANTQLIDLVVYANIWTDEECMERILKGSFDLMKSACEKFRCVWILYRENLVQVSQSGNPCDITWVEPQRQIRLRDQADRRAAKAAIDDELFG
jgi:hypothetical protein